MQNRMNMWVKDGSIYEDYKRITKNLDGTETLRSLTYTYITTHLAVIKQISIVIMTNGDVFVQLRPSPVYRQELHDIAKRFFTNSQFQLIRGSDIIKLKITTTFKKSFYDLITYLKENYTSSIPQFTPDVMQIFENDFTDLISGNYKFNSERENENQIPQNTYRTS